MRYTVVLTGDLPPIATSLLSPQCDVITQPTELDRSEEDLATLLAEADAAIVLPSDRVTRRVLEANPNLRIVANLGAGRDNIELDAARELGVLVTNTPEDAPEAMARIAATNILRFFGGAEPLHRVV
jgi:glyoxylate reductase